MLTFLGLFIVSITVSSLLFYPHTAFATKKTNGASALFTLLFMLSPIIVSVGLGEYLSRRIGENFPTYHQKLNQEDVISDDGCIFVIETYKPTFKNWKYYLIAMSSNNGVRGISKRIFLKVQKTE